MPSLPFPLRFRRRGRARLLSAAAVIVAAGALLAATSLASTAEASPDCRSTTTSSPAPPRPRSRQPRRRREPTTSPASRPPPIRTRWCWSTGRSPTWMTTGRRPPRSWPTMATASSRSTTAARRPPADPGHRGHRRLRRAAVVVRQRGAGRHRRVQGRPGRPLPGRHDAALLHQLPRRSVQGRHACGAGAVQLRHHPRRAHHAGRDCSARPPSTRAEHGLRGVRAAGGGLVLPGHAQRDPDGVRRVDYTVIETVDDEVVTPYTNAFLPAASNVTNITVKSVPAGLQRPPGDRQPIRSPWPTCSMRSTRPARSRCRACSSCRSPGRSARCRRSFWRICSHGEHFVSRAPRLGMYPKIHHSLRSSC